MMEGFDIFHRCFPELHLTNEQYNVLFDGCYVILAPESGIALVKENTIRLIAVLPEDRGEKTGIELLMECERYIKSIGYDNVSISGSPLCGAVGDSVAFFEKSGYTKHNDYVEMGMDIADYEPPYLPVSCDVEFRFCTDDIEVLRNAVASVDDEWVQYFTDTDTVFCGYVNGVLASFCIIGTDELCLLSDDHSKVGSIGCVGTVPQFRRKGIGLSMVSKATEFLKAQRCDKSFIHYTHLEKWYSKLGYRTFLRFSPMSKEI